jgi:Tfp pilus assembly protein FimT
MISVAIIGIFMGIGVPAIGDWIQNRQVNALAESIASGMRIAQSEAVQRNVDVDMVFTTSDVTSLTNPSTAVLTAGGLAKADPNPNWMVRAAGATTRAGYIQGKTGQDDSGNARFSGPAGARFSPLGRVSASIAADGTTAVPAGSLVFKIINPSVQSNLGTQRCVYVSTGGAVRVCDPRAPAGDARACLPVCAIP